MTKEYVFLTADIEECLRSICEAKEIAPISPETDLFAAGILDSLSVVQLVIQLENKYKIDFDYSSFTVDSFRTIDAITKTLESLAGKS